MEVVLTSSSAEEGVGCFELDSGAEHLRHKSCASPSHGLVSLGHVIASSEIRKPSAASGSLLYWSWSKPSVEVKSFPAEHIKPVAANSDGTYLAGGGVSGDIYLWEVTSGRLLKKWNAHYRAVTCLVFSSSDYLLISGSEDGSIKVWSLLMLFDDEMMEQASHPYKHSLSEHTLGITDIVAGFGSYNSIIVSASQDRTCKVWSLVSGELLRDIVFPVIINAVALDPSERVFFAGGRDGQIYVASLTSDSPPTQKYGHHIITSLSTLSKVVTCLEYSQSRNYLLSGSEDGKVRVWNAKTHDLVRVLIHGKGPVNNIIVTKKPTNLQASSKRNGSLFPALEKYDNSTEEDNYVTALIGDDSHRAVNKSSEPKYVSEIVANRLIKELQQQGSADSLKMELEKSKLEIEKLRQIAEKWKLLYENENRFCVDELLESDFPIRKCSRLK